jgi:hypothetical protein
MNATVWRLAFGPASAGAFGVSRGAPSRLEDPENETDRAFTN